MFTNLASEDDLIFVIQWRYEPTQERDPASGRPPQGRVRRADGCGRDGIRWAHSRITREGMGCGGADRQPLQSRRLYGGREPAAGRLLPLSGCSRFLVGLGPTRHARLAVLLGPAQPEKRPSSPCLGHRSSTVPDLARPEWPGVPCWHDPYRAGPSLARAVPAGPARWTSILGARR